MPPKINQNRPKTRNQSNQPLPDAMADCVFPEEIMLSIITRLPVKSLIRFKSVCKPWLELFATPNFIKSHYHHFSSDPENQNFMIYSLSETYYVHTMSLFRIESDEKKATDLNHPYPEIFFRMDFVGCCNGLICMACPPLGHGIVLWNPAMKLRKSLRMSKPELGAGTEVVSLGFGYDEEGDDFKVVRIVCFRGRKMKVNVEVYSAKSDSWQTIKVGLKFRVVSTKNDAIVGGIPYWVVKDVKGKSQIVWFDVKKMVCKMVPSSNLELGQEMMVLPLMEWKGSVATILYNAVSEREGHGSVHVLAFDKDVEMWNMVHIFGPIELKVYRCLQCSKSGKIIGLCFDGKLFVFDPESRGVKMFEVEEAPQMLSFQIHEYNESLAFIQGMEPVVVKTEEEGEADDEVEPDEVDPTAGPAIDLAGLMSYLQFHDGNFPPAI